MCLCLDFDLRIAVDVWQILFKKIKKLAVVEIVGNKLKKKLAGW